MADKRSVPGSTDIPILQSFQGKEINLLWDVIFRNRVEFSWMLKDIGVAIVFVYFAKSQLLNPQYVTKWVIRRHNYQLKLARNFQSLEIKPY